MIEIIYKDDELQVILGMITANILPERGKVVDDTYNTLSDILKECNVPYSASGVEFKPTVPVSLYYMDFEVDGFLLLGSQDHVDIDEFTTFKMSSEFLEILEAVGGVEV